jgi:hypothetical protein
LVIKGGPAVHLLLTLVCVGVSDFVQVRPEYEVSTILNALHQDRLIEPNLMGSSGFEVQWFDARDTHPFGRSHSTACADWDEILTVPRDGAACQWF